MPPLNLLSVAEQVAVHLRGGISRGQWTGAMPGVDRLSVELGINHKTAEAALRQLEREGVLIGRGPGRKRLIATTESELVPRPLRVAIQFFEPSDRHLEYVVELQHALAEAGHTVIFAGKSLVELKMDVTRVARQVRATSADAWIIIAGGREVLEWFCEQPLPAFAVFGRWDKLRIAAIRPDKPPAIVAATRALIKLGHRRVALLARRPRRLPVPGRGEQAFLDELKAHGFATGPFNLPDWEESPEGFQHVLNELFKVTPPSALIVDEVPPFVAAQQFLAGRRIRVPQEVSLVCTDPDPAFAWCRPEVAHIRWDSRPVVLRILRWATTVSRGREDVRQSLVPAEFVPGGTIGPAPARVPSAG